MKINYWVHPREIIKNNVVSTHPTLGEVLSEGFENDIFRSLFKKSTIDIIQKTFTRYRDNSGFIGDEMERDFIKNLEFPAEMLSDLHLHDVIRPECFTPLSPLGVALLEVASFSRVAFILNFREWHTPREVQLSFFLIDHDSAYDIIGIMFPTRT